MVERFQAMLPEEKPKEEQNAIIYLKQGKITDVCDFGRFIKYDRIT